ncbi:MAG TPA: hypothetical protein VJ583_02775 [Nitrososphaeraceae archaeon]|nr:hypothetical protein [Nitrososphaeraceae archaeon]
MFNYIKIIILLSSSLSLIFLTILSFDLEFAKSSGISFLSFGQNFDSVNNISSNSSSLNSSKIETTDWLTFSNKKFELNYPPDWKVEKKLSKFHVLDFKLIKDNPFSFIGISFSSLANSDQFTNEQILEESEKFGKSASSSGYKVYEVLEKNLRKYTIDANPSSFHIVKYKYKENNLEGKIMEIFSIIDRNLFTLTYQSTVENFDKDLPLVERIIDSIKILD